MTKLWKTIMYGWMWCVYVVVVVDMRTMPALYVQIRVGGKLTCEPFY